MVGQCNADRLTAEECLEEEGGPQIFIGAASAKATRSTRESAS